MKPNPIWIFFLLTGVSTIPFEACGPTEDGYRVRASFHFQNSSSFHLNYREKFHLAPDSIYTSKVDSEASGNLTIENCCDGFLEDFQGDYFQVYLILNDYLCVTYEKDEGPTSISNFVGREVDKNQFEFTYIFTDDQFADARECFQ